MRVQRIRTIAVLLAVLAGFLLGPGAGYATANPRVERDIAETTGGGPPAGSECTTWGLDWYTACWQAGGDYIWVRADLSDTDLTGVVFWWNYYPTDTDWYRQGQCYGTTFYTWQACNKNMHEDSLVAFRVCDADDSDEFRNCGDIAKTRT